MATVLSTAYENALGQHFAAICQLTSEQYKNGPPPGNNGQITPPEGYRQTAAFTAAEVETDQVVSRLFAARPDLKPLVDQVHQEAASGSRENSPAYEQLRTRFEAALKDPATVDALTAASNTVYIGFALEPDPTSNNPATNNVIALRGSESDYEWNADANLLQVSPPSSMFGSLLLGSLAHAGFVTVFGLIFDQFSKAVGNFNNELPLYVTGHSLGGALATLAALSAKNVLGVPSVAMYNFASPRVGNWSFATSFDGLVGTTYRVVNLADIVPVSPSPQIGLINYTHVGEEWSFLNQTGDGGNNHLLDKGYIPALDANVERNDKRSYPNTGIPCTT